MSNRSKKTVRLTVSLDQKDYAAVAAVADQHDASLSWVIRQAIHNFVHRADVELQASRRISEATVIQDLKN
ncbi:ribbon-helix-helix protein, CopG family [Sinorhizobium meliloti]